MLDSFQIGAKILQSIVRKPAFDVGQHPVEQPNEARNRVCGRVEACELRNAPHENAVMLLWGNFKMSIGFPITIEIWTARVESSLLYSFEVAADKRGWRNGHARTRLDVWTEKADGMT